MYIAHLRLKCDASKKNAIIFYLFEQCFSYCMFFKNAIGIVEVNSVHLSYSCSKSAEECSLFFL